MAGALPQGDIVMEQKPLTYKQKSSISFIDQDDPPFIKEIKKKMGVKEGPKLEDKFDEPGPSDIDDPQAELLRMKDEERPQASKRNAVVVLNSDTDLTREEVDKELEAKRKEEDDRKIAEGKITFKKPVKRCTQADEQSKVKEKKMRDEVKQPDSRLLSFGDDEEEED
ncbi:hypothetical protein DICVIV_05287 [Dictyocaulus viviparus]|uniref:DUF4604 domain-containing protein n=1 Tax=Dictyocaulus viviparus TaxID=29172 RepID=A0A0D8XVQ6_DICVI|nr:hypothetical protein DICVIV_05287 [Dictyocaulus viviparus]